MSPVGIFVLHCINTLRPRESCEREVLLLFVGEQGTDEELRQYVATMYEVFSPQ